MKLSHTAVFVSLFLAAAVVFSAFRFLPKESTRVFATQGGNDHGCPAPSVSISSDGYSFTVDGPCALSHYTAYFCDGTSTGKIDVNKAPDDITITLDKIISFVEVKAGTYNVTASRSCGSPTPTPTQPPVVTPTPTGIPDISPTPTDVPTPTPTECPCHRPTPTETPAETPTPTPGEEVTPTPTPGEEATPTPTKKPTPTPTNTPSTGGGGGGGSSSSTSSSSSPAIGGGEVLGAETLAATGTFAGDLANSLMAFGSVLTGVSLTAYEKSKQGKNRGK